MLRAIGLMSGTSMDGVDAAYVETDGERIGRIGPALTLAVRRGVARGFAAGAGPGAVAGPR